MRVRLGIDGRRHVARRRGVAQVAAECGQVADLIRADNAGAFRKSGKVVADDGAALAGSMLALSAQWTSSRSSAIGFCTESSRRYLEMPENNSVELRPSYPGARPQRSWR